MLRKSQSEFLKLLIKSALALIAGIPLFITSLLDKTLVIPGYNQLIWAIIGIIVFCIMWYSGGHFFSGAWMSFKSHKANMNTLIALATGPAWLYSMIIVASPTLVPPLARHVFFDAPLTVIGLLVLGAAFELLAGQRAALATSQLKKLMPSVAHRKKNGGNEDITPNNLIPNDIIEVSANEFIPADGVIIQGKSIINESKLAGTALEIEKTINDEVFAGTMNQGETLLIKITQPAKNSAISNIIEMIQQAQNSKPSISGFADKVASIFAPFVLILSFITLLGWFNFGPSPQIAYMLVTFMSVLLIACPCALGLATSISTTVGVSKAAQCGILFREGEAFMVAKKINRVMLDHDRPDALEVIERLKSMGIKTILLSDKNHQETQSLAKKLKIDEYFGNLSIANKIEKVKDYKKQGFVVAVIGDGKQDKALMHTASVSFALGIKAYAAQAAEIAVLSESIYGVVDAIRISKATLRNITQNLTGAFFYNLIGLPLAAGILYPIIHTLLSPIAAGALMACSSIAVILNANRLNLFKPLKRIEA